VATSSPTTTVNATSVATVPGSQPGIEVARVNVVSPPGQYRPGGTTTYSGPQIDVATRPAPINSTSTTTGNSTSRVPSYPTPASGTAAPATY
jgi:hypothetical protein